VKPAGISGIKREYLKDKINELNHDFLHIALEALAFLGVG
jgi:hypothetical protein